MIIAFLLALVSLEGALSDSEEDVQVLLKYSIIVDILGVAKITGKFTLSESLFRAVKRICSRHPEYLTRKYTGCESFQEFKNPKAVLDEDERAVLVSYTCPGFAYKRKDYWEIPDFPVKPKSTSGNRLEFSEKFLGRGDLTLHLVLPVMKVREVILPA